jgi:LysM repeat protein
MYLLSAADAQPGTTYDLGVYVIAAGDNVAKISRQFRISLTDLQALNPGLQPSRLRIGQRIRIYEKRRE